MPNFKDYLTVRDVANQLNLSEEWVRDLIAKKEIRATKIGRWRITRKDLDIFINSRSNF